MASVVCLLFSPLHYMWIHVENGATEDYFQRQQQQKVLPHYITTLYFVHIELLYYIIGQLVCIMIHRVLDGIRMNCAKSIGMENNANQQ